jgi:hypothetical protein
MDEELEENHEILHKVSVGRESTNTLPFVHLLSLVLKRHIRSADKLLNNLPC